MRYWPQSTRDDATYADGDVPFYAAHYVRLRGIPALRKEDAWVGFDIARDPENVAWYSQIGSPW